MLKLIKNPLKNFRYLLGIMHGSRAFIGPWVLCLSPINKCKNQCVYCWYYTPLKKEPKSKEWLNQKIDFVKLKSIIDEVSRMGTKKINLGGGGEPFLYQNVYELLEYIKKKGFNCTVQTNGVHIDKERIKLLFQLKVDEICLNLSSGSAKNYVTQHPNQNEKTFCNIHDWLLYLKKLKKDRKVRKPHLILLNIISKINYKDINEMFDFGEEVGADEIRLTSITSIEDTFQLLLNKNQRDLLYKNLLIIKKKVKIKHNINEFIRQIMYKSYLKGRVDRELPERMPCYVGWTSTEIRANGDVVPCCWVHNQPIGNIYLNRFKEIWYSREYNLFRKQSRKIKKDRKLKCICTSNKYVYVLRNCGLYPLNVSVHKILRLFNYRRIVKQEKPDKMVLK